MRDEKKMKQNLIILALAIVFSFLGLSFDLIGAVNYFIPIGNSEIFNFTLNVLMWFYILLIIYKLILLLITKILEYLKNIKIRINNYLQNLDDRFHEIKIISFINKKFFNGKGLPIRKISYLPNIIGAIIIIIFLSNLFDNESENNNTREVIKFREELKIRNDKRYLQSEEMRESPFVNKKKERVSCYLTNIDEDNFLRQLKPCQYNCKGEIVYKAKDLFSRKCAVEVIEIIKID